MVADIEVVISNHIDNGASCNVGYGIISRLEFRFRLGFMFSGCSVLHVMRVASYDLKPRFEPRRGDLEQATPTPDSRMYIVKSTSELYNIKATFSTQSK